MRFLKQNTAVTLAVGVFVDKADAFTPETLLTTGTVDEIGVYKHGGTAIVSISGTTTFTHRAGGTYTCTLSASDTDTVGHLYLVIREDATCRPKVFEFMVLPANVYDSLVANSDLLDVNMAQISGDSVGADMLEASTEGIIAGTAVAGTLSVTQMTTDLAETTDDHFNNGIVIWRSGALRYQKSDITDYDGGTKMFTYSSITEAPVEGDTFVVM
jgi:hypothetical protein